MATRREPTAPPAPRLYLVTPEVTDPAGLQDALSAALDTADIAAVLLHLADADERTLINRIKALAPIVQDRGAALILRDRPELVARASADGAHLTGVDTFLAVRDELQPERIAGCGGLNSKHEAMLAGENDTDYVMFGEPDHTGYRPSFEAVLDRVAWWAEVFVIPCVAFAAELNEVGPLAAAGADFIAIGTWAWSDPRGLSVAIADAAKRLTVPEPAP